MKKTLLLILGLLIGLLVIVTLIGVALPREHVATRTLKLSQSPEAVWQVMTDFANQPKWFSEITSVERLPDQHGHPVWRETLSQDTTINLEVTESTPPQRLVRRITNDDLPFGGEWEYHIKPAANGCEVTVTERGFVSNPIFRFMSRFIFGYASTIESYLKALAAKLGEPANIS
jgi:uncharacterized protein YndB with AHSA1/START domain